MSRDLVVLVNDVAGVMPDQSTTALALRAARRGWRVGWTDVAHLEVDTGGQPLARLRDAGPPARDPEPWLAAMRAQPWQSRPLEPGSLLLIRTNAARDPGRAALHQTALSIAALARDRGTVVLNDPDGVRRAGNKLYLSRLPAWTRPETYVSADPEQLAAWVRARAEPSVLKPLAGTQGTDVFRVSVDDHGNLRQICAVVCRGGYGVGQAYLADAPQGDVRLILLDGRLLRVQGKPFLVRRVPGTGEFRSNVAQGGHAAPSQLRPTWQRIVDTVGPQLAADGLWLVGLDLVGDHVVEANVASPGGFADAERFYGVDFTGAVLDALEARIT